MTGKKQPKAAAEGKQSKSKVAMNWTVLGMAALSLIAAATNYLETKTQALKSAEGEAKTLAQLETNYTAMKAAVEALEASAGADAVDGDVAGDVAAGLEFVKVFRRHVAGDVDTVEATGLKTGQMRPQFGH